jgi:hypothetical protein
MVNMVILEKEQVMNNISEMESTANTEHSVGTKHKILSKSDEISSKLHEAWVNAPFVKVKGKRWPIGSVLFDHITLELAKIGIDNIVIESTIDNSLLLKSDLNEKRLYMELFVNDEAPDYYDIVINLFKNKTHIFGTAGSSQETFTKLNHFLI